jgi:hypothetical protein
VRFSHDIDILIDEQQIDYRKTLSITDMIEGVFGQKPNCNKSCSSGIPLTYVSTIKKSTLCRSALTLMNTIPVSQKK